MSKGFAPILIILLIALAVGGYFIYQNQQKSASKPTPTLQQTTQPSAKGYTISETEADGWKTYTNNKYGYSVRYPGSWSESNSEDSYRNIHQYVLNLTNKSESISINVQTKNGDYNPESHFSSLYEHPIETVVSESGRTFKIENITFKSLPAVKYIDHPIYVQAVNEVIYVYKAPYLYILSARQDGSYEMDKDLEGNFNQILSTFKFTN